MKTQLFRLFLYERIIEPIMDFFLNETAKKVFLAFVSTLFYFSLATVIFGVFYTKFTVDYDQTIPELKIVSIHLSWVSLFIFWLALSIITVIFYFILNCLSCIDESWEPHSFLDNFYSTSAAFFWWPSILLGSLMIIVLLIFLLTIIVGTAVSKAISKMASLFNRSKQAAPQGI